GADVAGIDVLQLREDVAQLHALWHSGVATAGEELRVEIRGGEAEVVELQHPRLWVRGEPERIDGGDQVAAVGPDLDEARDRGLARIRAAGGRRRRRGPARCTRGDAGAHGRVRHLAGGGGAEACEVGAPLWGYARRVAQILLVERVEEVGVSAV